MSVNQREQRWLEVEQVGSKVPVHVKFESVDLGNGTPVVPAVRVGNNKPSFFLQQYSGTPIATSYLISVEDLRELLRLAEAESA